MKKRHNILIFAFLLVGCGLFGQDLTAAREAFAAGNAAYKSGDYRAALSYYQLADSNSSGSAIDYNLGNVYFRLGDMPRSILHYERALKYTPSNADVLHNLEVANTKIVDRLKTLPKGKLSRWWDAFSYAFSPDGWARISIFLACIGVGLLICYYLPLGRNMRRFGFFVGIIFLILTAAAFGLAQSAETYLESNNTAIVFTDKVDVKSEPRAKSTNVFVLHAGTKIKLIGTEGDWYQIKIASGNQGWMKKSDLEEI